MSSRIRLRRRPALAVLAGALAATVAGCAGGAQPGPTALPLRPTATADFATDELVGILDELIAAGAPAAVIEVREGEEAWSHSVGVESIASELPARADQTFRIASLTKPMLAAIVLQLVDEGRVGLDDPVAAHLPGPLDAAPAPVTVRMLLDHTSGIPEYVDVLTNGAQEITSALATARTDAQLLELATARPWSFEPGARFEYSNSNYIALTMLVEQVTGLGLAELVQERIAEPLGLSRTRLPDDERLGPSHLDGYWVEGSLRVNVTLQQASLWSGAGGIESNAADVNTFLRALMQGVVVPPELLGEMLALGPEGYGLGVQGRVDACAPGDAVRLPVAGGPVPEAGGPNAGDGADASGASEAEGGGADSEGADSGGANSGGANSGGGAADSGEEDAAPTDPGAGAPDLVGPYDDLADDEAGAGDAGDASGADGAGDGDGDGAGADPGDGASDDGDGPGASDGSTPSPITGSGALATDAAGAVTVQIGEPGLVYGHLGSGLGYRSIALVSADGVRQVTIAWTASPTDYGADPRIDIAYRLADAALSVRC